MDIFEGGRIVSRSRKVLDGILKAANQTEEITAIASDIEIFLQEYGMAAVHLRGRHRQTELVVIIKVGTSECENFWSSELHRLMPELVPKIYATGSRLGRINVHWLASEAIPFGPLGNSWNGKEFELLLDAGVRFYQAAKNIKKSILNETTLTEVTRWLQRSLAKKPPGPVDKLISKVDSHWGFLLEKCGSEAVFDDFHL